MTRTTAPKLTAYAGLAAFGLLAAVALGRPELAVLAAPFALVPALGLTLARVPSFRAWSTIEAERTVEGGEVPFELELRSESGLLHVEVAAVLPPGAHVAEAPHPALVRLGARQSVELDWRIVCGRWGAYTLGEAVVRCTDPLALFVYEQRLGDARPLKVYPSAERLRAALRPLSTQPSAGNQVARERGDGIEFADLRPFVHGDRLRRVNWRATARSGELWVNELHPERNTDVVLFLDTFVEARRGDAGTLDLAVRAAATLAEQYLAHRDRVGLVVFGGILNWLTPATGIVQRYRIVDALLDAEIMLSYAWKDIDVVPRRTLPPQALVVALSPLLDERALAALADLRRRGFDVAVIEISPVPFAPPSEEKIDPLVERLWLLRRAARRTAFHALGMPAVEWREGDALQSAIEEVAAFRRAAHLARR
ncbi:MAG TPA: DUF58 domain-containing protein [Gaiellaceae bacterium]|nr:DUF58 domain-containing protein [Gaiellaceae bacterium]